MRIFEEIASREDVNRAEIALYPEGLFYKAYERSAFAFATRISAFNGSSTSAATSCRSAFRPVI